MRMEPAHGHVALHMYPQVKLPICFVMHLVLLGNIFIHQMVTVRPLVDQELNRMCTLASTTVLIPLLVVCIQLEVMEVMRPTVPTLITGVIKANS
jgi:hypothetical protein